MSMWVSLSCSLALIDGLIILERWLVIVLAEDRSFTAGWLRLKHSFTVKAYTRGETESWFMSSLTNGPGTGPFFAASTVGKYLNWSELWYFLNVIFEQVFLAYFLSYFVDTVVIYVCMEAQFCLRVKNERQPSGTVTIWQSHTEIIIKINTFAIKRY